ncbi:hypothetical protein JZU71_01900, partial [bacterium]|nr:hypothetical protein [bacterium]
SRTQGQPYRKHYFPIPSRPTIGRLPPTPTVRTARGAWISTVVTSATPHKSYNYYVRCVRGGQ